MFHGTSIVRWELLLGEKVRRGLITGTELRSLQWQESKVKFRACRVVQVIRLLNSSWGGLGGREPGPEGVLKQPLREAKIGDYPTGKRKVLDEQKWEVFPKHNLDSGLCISLIPLPTRVLCCF